MKTCPNCKDLVRDDVKKCLKCRYSFDLGRVLARDEEAIEQEILREHEEKEQERMKQIGQEKQTKESTIIGMNPEYEYDVVVIEDTQNGNTIGDELSFLLKEHSTKGWRMVQLFKNKRNETKGSFGAIGGNQNSLPDQIVVVFERMIRFATILPEVPVAAAPAAPAEEKKADNIVGMRVG